MKQRKLPQILLFGAVLQAVFTTSRSTPQECLPKDCSELYYAGQTRSGVYTIFPFDSGPDLRVFCDMEIDGGGWTVIMRRGQYLNPVFYFYKTWTEYKRGFGVLEHEFWLGNEYIHHMTNQKESSLRIDAVKFNGEKIGVSYDLFRVGNESSGYKLEVADYKGKAGLDYLTGHNGKVFHTKDKDHKNNWAKKYKGAWWYLDNGYHSQLTGLNFNGRYEDFRWNGISWGPKDGYDSLAKAEMKIRPVFG